MIDLYTQEGWLNVPALDNIPGIWLIVIVGARQIGKTYGILKLLCEKKSPFVYIRRTKEELDLIASDSELDPFKALEKEGKSVQLAKSGKTFSIIEPQEDGEVLNRGIAVALSTLSKMRGFNGSAFTDVFLDEFIPEKTVIKRRYEGDALLNAYTTINGNREIAGKPPLKLWLAANAFDQENIILQRLGLINVLDRMKRRKEEYTIVNSSCLVVRPLSKSITEKHAVTAMNSFLRAQGSANEYLDTAVNNTFAYDNEDNIKPRSIAGHRPLCGLGEVFVYSNGSSLYVCKSKHGKKLYRNNNTERIRCQLEFPVLRSLYADGKVYFSDAETKLAYKHFLDIDF